MDTILIFLIYFVVFRLLSIFMVFNLVLHLYDVIVIDFDLFYEVEYLVIIKKVTPNLWTGWNFMKKFYEFHLNLRRDFIFGDWWLKLTHLFLFKIYYYCCTSPISFYFFLNIRLIRGTALLDFWYGISREKTDCQYTFVLLVSFLFLIWKITGKDRLSVHFCTFDKSFFIFDMEDHGKRQIVSTLLYFWYIVFSCFTSIRTFK